VPTTTDILRVARLFLFVREAGPNKGQRVEAIQKWCGGSPGQSWCCYWVTMVLDLAFGGQAPIPREGACQSVYTLAKSKGWVTHTPEIGDLFLYVNADDHAHHIGIVTGINPLIGIAGNTSEDGKSNNGDRVAERPVNASVFVHYPRTP